MREIKKGDKIVRINPKVRFPGYVKNIGKVEKCHVIELDPEEDYCLAPPLHHKYEAGDWVLPVISEDAGKTKDLLKPTKVWSLASGWCSVECEEWYWAPEEIVPITRDTKGYLINDSCRLTAAEFQTRYGCDPILIPHPDEEKPAGWDKRFCTRLSTPDTDAIAKAVRDGGLEQGDLITDLARQIDDSGSYDDCGTYSPRPQHANCRCALVPVKPWQPTPQDYAECCGVWSDDDAEWGDTPSDVPRGIRITEYCLPRDYKSRSDFDERMTNNGFTNIEPIPPKYIPGYQEPEGYDPYGLKRKYQHSTEWD